MASTLTGLARSFFNEYVLKDHELGLYDAIVQFDVIDGESFHVFIRDGQLEFKDGWADGIDITDIILVADETNFYRIFQGKASPASLYFERNLYVPNMKCKQTAFCWIMRVMRRNQENMLKA